MIPIQSLVPIIRAPLFSKLLPKTCALHTYISPQIQVQGEGEGEGEDIHQAINQSFHIENKGDSLFSGQESFKMESLISQDSGLNLKATELTLGLPGRDETEKETISSFRNNKRAMLDSVEDSGSVSDAKHSDRETAPAAKTQVVGWPPIRSYRKNSFQPKKAETENGIYVKVSMDGAPYLRKIDLKVYKGYSELLKALENMFKLTIGEYSEREGYKGSEFAPTYEDKDDDWMLVGDVPWDMFMSSCKRLRIMKASEASGLR